MDQSVTKESIVVTVHGIRTRGVWQKVAATVIARKGMIPVSPDYGRFGLLRLSLNYFRARKIEWFHRFYSDLIQEVGIDTDDPRQRPSVIAHSFGSYIVANCMMKYSEVQINKFIVCGSIIERDFNWSLLFARDQVNEVLNDCGLKDIWVQLAPLLVHDAGPSGRDGFTYFGSLLEERPNEHLAHSEYFTSRQMEKRWLPTTQKPPSRLRILHSREIDSGDKMLNLLNSAHAIDSDRYSDEPGYLEQELPRGLSSKWLEVNSDLYIFLLQRRTGQLIGYTNVIPVTKRRADAIRKGDVADHKLSPDDILPFGPSSTACSLYLMSIAEQKGGQFNCGLYPEPLERLINAVLSKLYFYAFQFRFVASEILAVGWTPQGRRLCQIFGMIEVARDNRGRPVYRLLIADAMASNAKVHSGVKKLALLYRKRRLL